MKTLGDPLTLDTADQNLPAPLRDFLTGVPDRRVTLSPGASGLHIDGTVLTISGTSTAPWPITNLGDAAVAAESAEIRCGADDQVSGVVTGKLPLNASVRAAVTVASAPPVQSVDDTTARGWRITLAADATGVTPFDILLLGQSDNEVDIAEPPGLDALRKQLTLPTSGFDVTFYPGTAYEPYLTFEVDVPNLAWTPVPHLFTLDTIGLAGMIGPDAWSVSVVGRFALGGVPMQLLVGLTDGTVLLATLKPVGTAAFPGLAALASWVAGTGSGGATDPGVGTIGGNASAVDAAIRGLSVRFDCATAKLQLVEVLTVLTLGALELDVAFRYPEGSIVGGLRDGKPLALDDVLTSFGLPTADLPTTCQITEAKFSAAPATGTYFADLDVDTNLTAGPLTIERVFFSLSRTPADGVTGQLGGTIAFTSGIEIDLLAAYGGAATGWEFSGRTDPGTELHIGDLLADLAAAFGATNVPEPVRSLVLSDISLDYQTGTGAFAFTCTGSLSIADVPVSAVVAITVTPTKPPAPAGFETLFTGHITIGGVPFDLIFDTVDAGAQTFIASYSHTGPAQAVSLHDLVAGVSETAARLVPGGLDIGLSDARLLYTKPATGDPVFALGLVLSAAVDLSQLPLVGDRLPAGETLAVDGLQIFYSSATLTTTQLETLGKLLPKTATPLPTGPLGDGVSISARLQAGPTTQNAALTVPPAAPAAAGTKPPAASPAGYWLDVHRQLGVVQINRIGLLYQSGALFVGLDAAITLGPLSISLDGLCFGSPLTAFVPEFRLSGLGVSYASGPLTISGALLRVPDDKLASGIAFQFDGTVQISAESLELAGLGSYAQFTDGQPSMFIYAQLETPLGGPPAFFVDGLMAGFGFNRSLELPAPDEVTAFPLVALGTPSAPGKPPAAQDPGHILAVLEGREPILPGKTAKAWIAPKPGAIWLALGVAFTSYELVQTRALLVADISEHFKLAVLGSSVFRLPQATDSPMTYAYVELGIEAVLAPEDGYFTLTAILSPNSYVIAPECHLTGGFAVAAWFGNNPHAGEFVLTLGGYHPAFSAPSYFPAVPRLGFRWSVSDTVTISGSAYAALTTSCFMAGGRLEAVFQDGGLRAWFTIEADLLISWRPFFFTGHFALSIGVSYSFSILGIHKTISVSVGAGLDLWGPPTGGEVHVSLWVVSFTVAFGAGRSGAADAALNWPQFRDLLPSPKSTVVIQPAGELLNTLPAGTGATGADQKIWVVRATGFSFSTQSALPVSDLRYGPATPAAKAAPNVRAAAVRTAAPKATVGAGAGLTASAAAQAPNDHTADPIDIKPMNLTGVSSVHRLTVRFGSPTAAPHSVDGWTLTPRSAAVPDSLWGKPPADFSQIPARPAAEVLPGRLVGYDVRTPPPALGANHGTVPASALANDFIARAGMPLAEGAPAGRYRPTVDPNSVAEIAGIAGRATQRGELFDTLKAATGFAGPNGPLDRLAAQAGQLYSDSPMREG
ncbi:DUF6603 domain-containing protein [Catenulispora rubra]|uniref:DUF6603 domain-containing protein n=1 Tax=Catenulispora rubra TaxID=280293 RepID=UPI001891FAB1|nr:DUF6603 domain-containing protein [Catenulispora rubra]